MLFRSSDLERKTQIIAGHSLGEIVGLYSADVLDAETESLKLCE